MPASVESVQKLRLRPARKVLHYITAQRFAQPSGLRLCLPSTRSWDRVETTKSASSQTSTLPATSLSRPQIQPCGSTVSGCVSIRCWWLYLHLGLCFRSISNLYFAIEGLSGSFCCSLYVLVEVSCVVLDRESDGTVWEG